MLKRSDSKSYMTPTSGHVNTDYETSSDKKSTTDAVKPPLPYRATLISINAESYSETEIANKKEIPVTGEINDTFSELFCIFFYIFTFSFPFFFVYFARIYITFSVIIRDLWRFMTIYGNSILKDFFFLSSVILRNVEIL